MALDPPRATLSWDWKTNAKPREFAARVKVKVVEKPYFRRMGVADQPGEGGEEGGGERAVRVSGFRAARARHRPSKRKTPDNSSRVWEAREGGQA